MRLTVLGSGTAIPSARRGSPAYLLESGSAVALIDSGPGTLRQLARAGRDFRDLTDLLYTHAHPDHCLDLWALLFASRNPREGRGDRPLRLHGSPGFLDFYRRVSAAFGRWAEPRGYSLEEVEHRGEEVAIGLARVSGHPVRHLDSSVAYRFREPRAQGGEAVLVLSGDTDDATAMIEVAREADVLVLECSTPDEEPIAGHLTPMGAAGIAAAADVQRLLLTHLYPAADRIDVAAAVRARWPGAVETAEDFLVVEP